MNYQELRESIVEYATCMDAGKRFSATSVTISILANHAVVSVGPDLDLAYVRSSYGADAAQIIPPARCIGAPYAIPMR